MYLGLTYVDHEPYGPPERRHKNAFMNLTTYIKYLDFENMFLFMMTSLGTSMILGSYEVKIK
jgi:hypothetical protein